MSHLTLLHRVNRLWINCTQPALVPGWLSIEPFGKENCLIRWKATLPDNGNPKAPKRVETGRAWLLFPDATDNQIVNTFLAAMLTFMEHEIRETLLVNGISVFMPRH